MMGDKGSFRWRADGVSQLMSSNKKSWCEVFQDAVAGDTFKVTVTMATVHRKIEK